MPEHPTLTFAAIGLDHRHIYHMVGRLLALVSNLTGQKRRVADPAAYLRDWRSRGAIGRVINPLRTAMKLK